MRVLLLNPPYKFKISRDSRWPELTKSGTLYYPIWLSYAAGLLLKKGHHVKLVDAIANGWNNEKAMEELMDFGPQLLVVNTSTPTIKSDIAFVEEVKKQIPAVKIAMVGPHPSALAEQVLSATDAVDFIARHEYDYTLADLIAVIEGTKKIETILGVSYKKNKIAFHNKDRPFITSLDDLPFVSEVYKKFLNIKKYRYALARHPMIQIFSSRGCPNMCTFCVYPQAMMGRVCRARSPENFVVELQWIKQNMPEVKEIFIEDDTFSVDKERVKKICDLIIRKELDIVWSVNVRADIPLEVLKKMKQAGCRMLIVGYESGNQEVLNKIKKGITLQMAEQFTADAKKAGLKIFGCFMIGLPGDTKETIEQTFEFAKKLNPDMAFFQQAVPFPGTEFYAWAKQNGYLQTEDYEKWLTPTGQLGYLVNYEGLSKEEIEKIRDKLMIRFYTSKTHLWQTIRHNMNFEEAKRLSKAALDYTVYIARKKIKRKK
jgi:radical SAM superfamily enzyme YgiQ (UPF0313 family)